MESLNIKLFSNYIILDLIPRNETKLVLLDSTKDNVNSGIEYDLTVVGVSNELDEKGSPFIKNVKVSDVVMLSPISTPVSTTIGGKKYLICRETELIGIYVKKELVN